MSDNQLTEAEVAEMRMQFDEIQVELIKEEFARLYEDFKDNISATDRMQLIDVCLYQQRHNNHARDYRVQHEALQAEREKCDGTPASKRVVAALEVVLVNHEKAMGELSELKRKTLASLIKVRRDLEHQKQESKGSFLDWVQSLQDHPNVLKEMFQEHARFMVAVERERERLSQYHTYQDDTVDKPFLTPEGEAE